MNVEQYLLRSRRKRLPKNMFIFIYKSLKDEKIDEIYS